MYGLNGYANNIQNLYKLISPFLDKNSIRTSNDLKEPYIQFLNKYQSKIHLDSSFDLIVREPNRALELAGAFSASQINDLSQESMVGKFYEGADRKVCEGLVQNALNHLSELNPEARDLLNLVVHSILICGSNLNSSGLRAYGGTSSKCIGLMWLSLRENLSIQDVIELLIHEMTHTLIFLDEFSHPQFNYSALFRKENWAQSSILMRPRPMDKVVHSIIVAFEVLYARENYLKNADRLQVHPPSEKIKENIRLSIESVKSHPNLEKICKPRALELISKVESRLNHI